MINQKLLISNIGEDFRSRKRAVIYSFLQPEVADSLYQCLINQIPWELVFRDNGQVVSVEEESLSKISNESAQEILDRIQRQAKREFQFLYWKYSIVDAFRKNTDQQFATRFFLEQFASKNIIDFFRNITAQQDINRIDAQATMYRPGNFLKTHDDQEHLNQRPRRLAYVLQLTRGWQADWGGLLHFVDQTGQVVETFTPSFNSLVIFSVPQNHFVSMVATYATAPRLAITGWLTT